MVIRVLNKTLALVVITTMLIGCTKKVDCDNAQICLKNIGNDTIWYCWGCSGYTETLLPGDKACKYVGEVYIKNSSESIVWIDFTSDHGHYRMKVDDCYIEKEIQ
jgi:hypothetical protein